MEQKLRLMQPQIAIALLKPVPLRGRLFLKQTQLSFSASPPRNSPVADGGGAAAGPCP